ncbi:zinc finger protein 182-like [Plodia interpunctella]|uniref:zinc finger protein 182-like n=1 Tax=Plodia interpunctella TaxID=58824 RepID=UPI002368AC38|nr:zinc finger protein 182-like [Plodia interpunctella]XP_053620794.1 zinc finger protein 182-like [Plodia interpunctella]XP_053620795.1 zinc finger protein 182-like [Plodia interpunctella]
MPFICLICNYSSTARNFINIFGNHSSLQSQKKLSTLLSEVFGIVINEETVTSKVICTKCFKDCSEYDSIQVRQQVIKTELQSQFREGNASRPQPQQSSPPVKIVLPASKLQPLPKDFVIDRKLVAASKSQLIFNKNNATFSPKFNIKSVIVPSQNIDTITSESEANTSQSNSDDTLTDPSKIPGNLVKHEDVYGDEDGDVENNNDDIVEHNDDHPMEIDEDCSLAVVPVSSEESGKLVYIDNDTSKDINEKSQNFIDLGLLLADNVDTDEHTENGVAKIEMNEYDEDDDDDDEAIIMADENGATIIRLASSHRILYGNTQFVVEEQEDNDNNSRDSTSNSYEESQIELQVSGDEETANAIIAAAQEQGGAFIEVESGEMFRVKSVQSKTDKDVEDDALPLVKPEDGKFRCLLCDQNTKEDKTPFLANAEEMMQHLKTSHDARLYICDCGKIMRKRSLYSAHIVDHMPKSVSENRLHECAVCGRRYSNKTLLREHIHTHTGDRPYSCNLCDKTFANKYTHQAHLKIHEVRPRPHKCKQCGKTFLTQQNLSQHEKTHLGIRNFICQVCNKAFATQHNLEVHGVIHSGKRPFACTYCPKAFARRAELRDHTRIHTGERPFACDICSATFTQRSNLLSHKRATHLDDKRYHCKECPKQFKRRRLLDYHIKAAHTGERPLQCPVCPSNFVYPEHYKKHMRIHTGVKPYFCEVCGKSFSSRDNRNTHRFVHSEKKPYECLTCGAGYRRKQLLYAHMNSTGHVAESIVVNQPRVIKATDTSPTLQRVTKETLSRNDGSLDESNLNSQESGTIALEGNKLFITGDQALVLEEGSTINMVNDGSENLFLQELNASIANVEGVGDVKLENRNLITTDENGELMRLIQIQLADGKSRWVAFN